MRPNRGAITDRVVSSATEAPKPTAKMIDNRWDYERNWDPTLYQNTDANNTRAPIPQPNAGLTFAVNGDTGERIYMYNDAEGVGIYLNEQGKPVSEEVARKAGFDVAAHKAQRNRAQAYERAKAAVDAQYKIELERIEAEGDQPPVLAGQVPAPEHPDLAPPKKPKKTRR